MSKYLRLGKIPSNERSINYFKLTLDESEDFSFFLEMGDTPEQAAEALGLKDCWEDGVSVFQLDDDGEIILNNVMLIRSLCSRLNNEPAYIVEADCVGKGNDGEPLVNNICKVIPITLDIEHISNRIYNLLKDLFENHHGKRDARNLFFGDFYSDDLKCTKWHFNGVDFYGAKADSFVTVNNSGFIRVLK